MRKDQIALQLYTLREASKQDFIATLRKVAELGYRAVEPAGLYNVPAADVRATLDELGVRVISAHVPLDSLESNFAGTIADVQALGSPYVTVPFVAEARRATAADVSALAATLNELGQQARDSGLQLAYHHHAFEFAPLDSGTMWDILTAETDPGLVALQLDVFWAARGGKDPAALIAQHADRVRMLHLKDLGADGSSDVPAGTGSLDWDGILAAARAANVEWYICEQDNPGDAVEDSRLAYEKMAERSS
jgi:sugar phosphate isomerase/epimerase